MNEPTSIGQHKGYEMFFAGISYNCPALKLYGYSTDLSLIRAIDALLRKREKRNTARRERDQLMRDMGLVKVKGGYGGTTKHKT